MKLESLSVCLVFFTKTTDGDVKLKKLITFEDKMANLNCSKKYLISFCCAGGNVEQAVENSGKFGGSQYILGGVFFSYI